MTQPRQLRDVVAAALFFYRWNAVQVVNGMRAQTKDPRQFDPEEALRQWDIWVAESGERLHVSVDQHLAAADRVIAMMVAILGPEAVTRLCGDRLAVTFLAASPAALLPEPVKA